MNGSQSGENSREKLDVVIGCNAVLELLRSSCKNIKLITITENKQSNALSEIVNMAKKRNIPVDVCNKETMNRVCENSHHQGVLAYTLPYVYYSVDDILAYAKRKKEDAFVLIADKIEDPHNLGAMIRTAECAGVHGVIIPKDRAASVNHTVNATSAGATAHIMVARVTNIARTIDDLKKKGLWVFGAEADGTYWSRESLTGPVAMVIGSEGRGISRLVREKCDAILSLPLFGEINSLNASVTTGIMLYEIVRQRNLLDNMR